jgi:dihydrofolate synthase/folylpolyglutamate synthase
MIELDNLLEKIINNASSEKNLFDYKSILSKIRPTYPIILVTGTNGKGSVCAYLEKILCLSGYKTGVYTSPHVLKYNERIAINGDYISDEDLYNYLLELIQELDYWNNPIGLFKLFTFVAHKYFCHNCIDIMVCEVGIGGAKDITNSFEPDISVITRVALDHCNVLGNNREQIGYQKAHVFRSNKPAIYGEEDIPCSVREYAEHNNINITQFGKHFSCKILDRNSWNYIDLDNSNNNLYSLPTPAMRGKQQIANSAISICVIQNLQRILGKFVFSKSVIKQAILETRLKGRFEILPGYPRVVLDVAHNPDSVANMVDNMIELGLENSIAVFAVAKDKDVRNIIKNCKQYFKSWYIAPTNYATRSSSVDYIYRELLEQGVDSNSIFMFETVLDATQAALAMRKKNYDIVIFGSFLTVAEAMNCNI